MSDRLILKMIYHKNNETGTLFQIRKYEHAQSLNSQKLCLP